MSQPDEDPEVQWVKVLRENVDMTLAQAARLDDTVDEGNEEIRDAKDRLNRAAEHLDEAIKTLKQKDEG